MLSDLVKCFYEICLLTACLKAVVDGGINELYNCPDLVTDQFIPDFISGDFDSAKPEVLEYYRKKVSHVSINIIHKMYTMHILKDSHERLFSFRIL